MYLPKNRYKLDNTPGDEFVLSDGSSYSGPVIRTSKGEVFAGSSLQEISAKLINKDDFKNTSILELEVPYNDYYGPTNIDYQKGFYIRYFLQDIKFSYFKEVSKTQYDKYRSNILIVSGQLKWFLTGPVGKTEINGYIYEGTENKNIKSMTELLPTFPFIFDYLDPKEYIK